jgi:programmed cell death 6-interacting protein
MILVSLRIEYLIGNLTNIGNSGQAILVEAARFENEFPMMKLEPRMFEPFFTERLKRYDEDRNLINTEHHDQDALGQKLRAANDNFKTALRGEDASKERRDALQALENGFFKYKEIISNLDLGRNFYNDLGPFLSKFRESCRAFVAQRRAEAAQTEM